MQNSRVTHFLLALIATLLLILVIQNGRAPRAPQGSQIASDPHQHGEEMPPALPPSQQEANPHTDMGGFKPSNMVYAALVCPSDGTLTLSDAACTGKDADLRRSLVDQNFEKGARIPQVFDAVVAKFGEAALTPEAIDIRRARKK